MKDNALGQRKLKGLKRQATVEEVHARGGVIITFSIKTRGKKIYSRQHNSLSGKWTKWAIVPEESKDHAPSKGKG